MKILITEAQLRLLRENDVAVYHDETQQYSSTSTDVKHFYTEIEGADIYWDTNRGDLHEYDINYHDHPTKITVDWSCNFLFDEAGFTYKPVFKSVTGVIYLTSYDSDLGTHSKPIVINVDTRKGYKLDQSNLSAGGDTIKISSVRVNIDSKLISLSLN